MPAASYESSPSVERTSNLDPELAAYVRTPEFKAWFGDWEGDPANASKIVDENGEPALVYFGGPSGIRQLSGDKRNRTGADEVGFYFTKLRGNAKFYAETMRDPQTDEPVPSSLYSAFLNIKDPYVRERGDGVRTERVTAVPEGHDGYINDGAAEIVVFSPDQVAFAREDIINPPTAPAAPAPRTPLSTVVQLQK
jgi:hypothetical protein